MPDLKSIRAKFVTLAVSSALVFFGKLEAQNYDTNNVVVETFAGSGFYGYYDGPGMFTMFNAPSALVADLSSNLLVLDAGNSLIRKITPDAMVSTYYNYYGNSGAPQMAIDRSNTLYICGSQYSSSQTVLRISTNGLLSQLSVPTSGYPGAAGLCFDSANNFYIADVGGNKIYRQTTNGLWEVFAGSGNPGAVDGNWIFSSFNGPRALAADSANNIYVWDSNNHLIRRINPNRDIETIAGTYNIYFSQDVDGIGRNASFNSIYDMRADAFGNLILACGTSVRKVTSTTNVLTIAGSFNEAGYTNGPGSTARFRNASGICLSQGRIFVADSSDHRIREITFNATAESVPGADLNLKMYAGLEINGIAGRSYRIESSTNLDSWVPEETVFLTSSRYLWIDPAGAKQKKYYRALLLP